MKLGRLIKRATFDSLSLQRRVNVALACVELSRTVGAHGGRNVQLTVKEKTGDCHESVQLDDDSRIFGKICLTFPTFCC